MISDKTKRKVRQAAQDKFFYSNIHKVSMKELDNGDIEVDVYETTYNKEEDDSNTDYCGTFIFMCDKEFS